MWGLQWGGALQARAKVIKEHQGAVLHCQAQELALQEQGRAGSAQVHWEGAGQSQHEGEGGAQGQPCLLLEEKDDPIVGHEPQLLVKAFCVAGLLFKADAGEAAAIQVGAIREPRVTSGLGAAQ